MIAHSKITSQGQISVPAEVRRQLGVGPGSVLAWEERDGDIVVRRAARHTSADIHGLLFPEGSPAPRSTKAMKEGIRRLMRKRHAGH